MSLYYFFYYNKYYLIFHNSLQAALILSLRSENAWFAALVFGGYNMWLATLLAFTGSTIGMSFNFGFGYYLSRWRDELPGFSEELYQRVSRLFRRRLFFLLALPPLSLLEFFPGVTLFALVCGMFRVPPKQAIAAIMIARILYYTVHLIS